MILRKLNRHDNKNTNIKQIKTASVVAGRKSVMIKKDWDGYEAKYEAQFGIFSRIMWSGGQKHHFLQDSVHISKFCANSAKKSAGAESQNPGGTVYRILLHKESP